MNSEGSGGDKIRVKLYCSYDGAGFNGWQRQVGQTRTVQLVLEEALGRFCDGKTHVTASGRTDAGVHARIQVAHADVPVARRALIENGRFLMALNSNLPGDVRIHRVEEVAPTFHAQRHVQRKTYLYFIDTSPVQAPYLRKYAWSLRLPMDWNAIEEATRALKGTHDFEAFSDSDRSTKTTTRTLFEAHWGRVSAGPFGPADLRVLRLTGNGFLKHMVRSIVGTLVKVGNGGADAGLVARSLATPQRHLVGATAPPQGLWLWDILYLT